MRILINSEFISPALITVKRDNIVKALGVPDGHADNYLLSLIDELMAQCIEICKPLAAVSVFDKPEFSAGELVLQNVTFKLNKMVTSALRKSTAVAIFAGTSGAKTSELSADLLKNGHPLEGLIVDIIGSEIAEGLAEHIHLRIGSEMSDSGYRITNRYSPGYCNWPVSDQQKLFGLLDQNNCGIKLTDSSLMIPIKSVSGITGLGKDVINIGYTCAWCQADHCLYRDRK